MTTLVSIELIASKIYLIRGMKIMLDRDLAELYGVETGALNRAVKRNAERFPEDFMFQITGEEAELLRCQTGISKPGRGGRRYLPYAFSEQGVAMLSSVLNSKRAIEVNIAIMRAFVQLRKMIDSHAELSRKLSDLERKLGDHDEQIQAIFEAIRQLMAPPDKKKRKIGYTVKEKQKAYVKRAKKNKPPLEVSFTPKAKKIWEAIAGDIQIKILNNVWCVHCRKGSSIGNLTGKIESGMLVLRGTCTKCGGDVARVIENE
ncbi:MAG: ORF6N domain-containing protein [Desulfobacterales bacterium]